MNPSPPPSSAVTTPFWWTSFEPYFQPVRDWGLWLLNAMLDYLTQPVNTHQYTQPNSDPLALPPGQERDKRIAEDSVGWMKGMTADYPGLMDQAIDLTTGEGSVGQHQQLQWPMTILMGCDPSQPAHPRLSVKLPRRQLFSCFPQAAVQELQRYLPSELDLQFLVFDKQPNLSYVEPILHHLVFPQLKGEKLSQNISVGVFKAQGVVDIGQACQFDKMHTETVSVEAKDAHHFDLSTSILRAAMTSDTPAASFSFVARVSQTKGIGAIVIVFNNDKKNFVQGSADDDFVEVPPEHASLLEALNQKNLSGLLATVNEMPEGHLKTLIKRIFTFNADY